MYLYHNVYSLGRLKSILESGFVYKDTRISKPCVYMTRDFNYLSERGIRMIFDYDKLKHNYRVRPFCFKGWRQLNNRKYKHLKDEFEERVMCNVGVMKTCVRIDIDKNKYKVLDFNHVLINHTFNFNNSKTQKQCLIY